MQQIFISYGVPDYCNLYDMLPISTLYSLALRPELQPTAVCCTACFLHQEPPTRATRWDLFAFVEVEDELRFPKLRKSYHRGFVFPYISLCPFHSFVAGFGCVCPN
jgi:hypothetical protein